MSTFIAMPTRYDGARTKPDVSRHQICGVPSHGVTVGMFGTKQEAELPAHQAASDFQYSGFDHEQGFWGGRNDGEVTVRFLVVAK